MTRTDDHCSSKHQFLGATNVNPITQVENNRINVINMFFHEQQQRRGLPFGACGGVGEAEEFTSESQLAD